MKEEVLSVENIQIQERSCDWKSAIETAVKPLIQNGFVEERYTAAILRNIEAWGPYFMAGPYILSLIHIWLCRHTAGLYSQR